MRLVYDGFARNGATLDGEAKKRYAEINQRLAQLHTQFANNVLADEEGYVTYLDESQTGGLPESFKAAAKAAAEARVQTASTRSSTLARRWIRSSPIPTSATLREKVWRTYYSRGDNGDEHDNNAIIAEILQLRDER